MKKCLIVILGPTASGKTALSIKLAKNFKGEIISADSRQVYRGMDIGTGKIKKKEMQNIPHHLLSIASPKIKFTVGRYQKLAQKSITKIFKKNKIPFLVGGSGFYIQSIIDGISIPEVKPDLKLRKFLEKKSTNELYKFLKKLDPRRAKTIEKENPRRLIRAIEIALKIGYVPFLKKKPLPYPVLILGIKKSPEDLKKLIKKRLLQRLKQGMIEEVKRLKESGVSWRRFEELGLEYRWLARYLKKEISFEEMILKLQKDIEKYAKRQISWFKKDKRIIWIKNYREAKNLIKQFLE